MSPLSSMPWLWRVRPDSRAPRLQIHGHIECGILAEELARSAPRNRTRSSKVLPCGPLAASYCRIESDPIGLAAGVNTYAYVGRESVTFFDPDGLDETKWVNTVGGRPRWDGPTNGNWGGKCCERWSISCGGPILRVKPPTDSGDKGYMQHVTATPLRNYKGMH